MTQTATTTPALGSNARSNKVAQKDTTFFWIGVSIVLHFTLILVTSVGFIRDTWIDPEGAMERKAQIAEDAARAAEAAKAAAAPAPAPVATTAPAAVGPAEAPTSAQPAETATPTKPVTDQEKTMEERKDAPVVKKATEVAKPSEIPKTPDDLGLNMDDINSTRRR